MGKRLGGWWTAFERGNANSFTSPEAPHDKDHSVSIVFVKKKLNTIQSSHPAVSPFRAGLRMINTKLLNNWRLKGVKQPLAWTVPTVLFLEIKRFHSLRPIWGGPSPPLPFPSYSKQSMCVRSWECVSWEPRDIVSCTCHQHAVVSPLIEEGRSRQVSLHEEHRLYVIQILFRFLSQLREEQTWETLNWL